MQEKITQNVNYFPLLSIADILQLQKIQKTKYYANRAYCTWELSKTGLEECFFPTKHKADVVISF